MRVACFVGFFLQFCGDLGVDGGGGKRAMSEEELYRFEVHAIFKPMSGDSVADNMRRDRACKAAHLQVFFEHSVYRTAGQSRAEPI